MMWAFWTFVACIIWTLTRIMIYDLFRQPRNQSMPLQFSTPRRRNVTKMVKKAHGNDLVEISGQVLSESKSGLAWFFYDGSKKEWIPKSQCEWDEETKVMTMPEWLAIEKGFV